MGVCGLFRNGGDIGIELQQHGFVRPTGPGKATRGWVHPELRLGFEVVCDVLLDGLADREMVQVVELAPDGALR